MKSSRRYWLTCFARIAYLSGIFLLVLGIILSVVSKPAFADTDMSPTPEVAESESTEENLPSPPVLTDVPAPEITEDISEQEIEIPLAEPTQEITEPPIELVTETIIAEGTTEIPVESPLQETSSAEPSESPSETISVEPIQGTETVVTTDTAVLTETPILSETPVPSEQTLRAPQLVQDCVDSSIQWSLMNPGVTPLSFSWTLDGISADTPTEVAAGQNIVLGAVPAEAGHEIVVSYSLDGIPQDLKDTSLVETCTVLPAADALLASLEAPVVYQPITPLISCVSKTSSGEYIAQLGYENNNDIAVNVMDYGSISITPEDFGGDLPDVFDHGVHLFLITFDGSDRTLTISPKEGTSSSITVNKDYPERCQEDVQPTVIAPINIGYDCVGGIRWYVDNSTNSFDVRFDWQLSTGDSASGVTVIAGSIHYISAGLSKGISYTLRIVYDTVDGQSTLTKHNAVSACGYHPTTADEAPAPTTQSISNESLPAPVGTPIGLVPITGADLTASSATPFTFSGRLNNLFTNLGLTILGLAFILDGAARKCRIIESAK